MTEAAGAIEPEILEHLIEIAYLGLYAFGIFMAGIAVIFSVLFWKGNLSGETVISIIRASSAPKLVTIILIVATVAVLTVLELVDGAAALALLSAIAGYVLGNTTAPKSAGAPKADEES